MVSGNRRRLVLGWGLGGAIFMGAMAADSRGWGGRVAGLPISVLIGLVSAALAGASFSVSPHATSSKAWTWPGAVAWAAAFAVAVVVYSNLVEIADLGAFTVRGDAEYGWVRTVDYGSGPAATLIAGTVFHGLGWILMCLIDRHGTGPKWAGYVVVGTVVMVVAWALAVVVAVFAYYVLAQAGADLFRPVSQRLGIIIGASAAGLLAGTVVALVAASTWMARLKIGGRSSPIPTFPG